MFVCPSCATPLAKNGFGAGCACGIIYFCQVDDNGLLFGRESSPSAPCPPVWEWRFRDRKLPTRDARGMVTLFSDEDGQTSGPRWALGPSAGKKVQDIEESVRAVTRLSIVRSVIDS